MAQLKDLIVNGDSRIIGATYGGDATFSGTVSLTKNADVSATADNKPALIIGSSSTTSHIEIDCDEIMAKADGDTAGILYLNHQGGDVQINGRRVSLVYSGSSAPAASTGKNGDIYIQV